MAHRNFDYVQTGSVYQYRGRVVYITSGAYENGGRISNFFHFREVRPDGTLSKKEEGDYDNTADGFTEKLKAEITVRFLPMTVEPS